MTFNDLENLKLTINSCSYPSKGIEHIIIDGFSTDSTIPYLKSLNLDNLSWYSEPDKGIYDAMNKGLRIAVGEYVIFMNAGDTFYNQSVLTELYKIIIQKSPDIIYGETMYINKNREPIGKRSKVTTRKLPNQLHWRSMKRGMVVCHQSFISKKAIAPFYILGNLSADIDWQIKCLKKAHSIIKYDSIISNYLVGGISSQNRIKSLVGRFKVLQSHFGRINNIGYHLYFLLRSLTNFH